MVALLTEVADETPENPNMHSDAATVATIFFTSNSF